MRLLLLADGEVGNMILEYLLKNYHKDVAFVVAMRPGPVLDLAIASDVPCMEFSSEDELIDMLPADIDLGLLAWWPKIIKKRLMELPKFGFINTHPSLLPWNRGKHYNFWAIVESVPFGVTLHKVNSGIDRGDIVAQKRIPYSWTDTGESLYRLAQESMVSLFETVWPRLREGEISLTPQQEGVGSFHLASELEEASRIDLDSSYVARDMLNLLRAKTFPPHPGCWFEEDGQRYEIKIKISKTTQ